MRFRFEIDDCNEDESIINLKAFELFKELLTLDGEELDLVRNYILDVKAKCHKRNDSEILALAVDGLDAVSVDIKQYYLEEILKLVSSPDEFKQLKSELKWFEGRGPGK